MSPALASRLVASALLVMLIACVPPAPTFTITYDANGGAGTVPTDTKTDEEPAYGVV